MRVFEFDVMGEFAEERSFRELVASYNGRWWILAKQGPGGGNPSYLAAFNEDTDVYRFFEEYGGRGPIKVIGGKPPKSVIPEFGVMELSADHILSYSKHTPSEKGGVYALNKVRICQQLVREMRLAEAVEIFINRLLEI